MRDARISGQHVLRFATAMMYRAGFTLIELLIVITIIGILSTAGMFMVGNKLKSARDADRQTDIYEIRLGLEQYFNDQDHYPVSLTFDTQPLTNPDGQQIFIPRVHQDILNRDPYLYTYNASPAAEPVTYDLCAYRLEVPRTAERSFCLHQMQ